RWWAAVFVVRVVALTHPARIHSPPAKAASRDLASGFGPGEELWGLELVRRRRRAPARRARRGAPCARSRPRPPPRLGGWPRRRAGPGGCSTTRSERRACRRAEASP